MIQDLWKEDMYFPHNLCGQLKEQKKDALSSTRQKKPYV